MTAIFTVTLMLVGTAFGLLAAVAVVRMPDLFTRMHGATKCATLGVGCLLLAVAVDSGDVATATPAVLVIGFLFLTAPIAAHMIARSGHRLGVPMWKTTVVDQSPPRSTQQRPAGNVRHLQPGESDPAPPSGA